VQQSGDVFQKFNNTIHKAAPIIEYAVNAISARLAKVNFDYFKNFFCFR
jgi:hypothetical protein